VKYLAAFTCAILNNQPMGFYTPAVLVKDAQRHGLRVRPIDVQQSDWSCTIESLSSRAERSEGEGSAVVSLHLGTNRVPHICPQLADVGMHDARLGTSEPDTKLVSKEKKLSSRAERSEVEGSAFLSAIRYPLSADTVLRLGLGYARGLRQQVGEAIVAARRHARSLHDPSTTSPSASPPSTKKKSPSSPTSERSTTSLASAIAATRSGRSNAQANPKARSSPAPARCSPTRPTPHPSRR
jgi:DNA polymerase III alpha subunit